MSVLMQALDAKLPRDDADAAGIGGGGAGGWGGTIGGKIRELFEIELESTSRCAEAGAEEEAVMQQERALRLALNIDSKTNVIHDAIKSSLAYEVSKTSPSLKREARYHVTQRERDRDVYVYMHTYRHIYIRIVVISGPFIKNLLHNHSVNIK